MVEVIPTRWQTRCPVCKAIVRMWERIADSVRLAGCDECGMHEVAEGMGRIPWMQAYIRAEDAVRHGASMPMEQRIWLGAQAYLEVEETRRKDSGGKRGVLDERRAELVERCKARGISAAAIARHIGMSEKWMRRRMYGCGASNRRRTIAEGIAAMEIYMTDTQQEEDNGNSDRD